MKLPQVILFMMKVILFVMKIVILAYDEGYLLVYDRYYDETCLIVQNVRLLLDSTGTVSLLDARYCDKGYCS